MDDILGLQRCSSDVREGKAWRARLARGKRSRIMSDELRSALALSRAREQIHKAHLKEVQGENKRLKEQLKEEKILYQQTLKKLHGLQQAGTRNRSPKSSRRASTGGGRMLGKGLGSPGTTLADVFKNVGTQTKRVSNLLQPRRNVAEKKLNEQVGNLSRQLQQEQAAAADNKKGEGGKPELGHAHGRDQNI